MQDFQSTFWLKRIIHISNLGYKHKTDFEFYRQVLQGHKHELKKKNLLMPKKQCVFIESPAI